MKQRAVTLVELMVAITITGLLFAGIFTIFVSLNGAQSFSVTMPQVQGQAQQMAMTVAGAIRRATLCGQGDSDCTLDAALQDTATSGLTVYSRSSGTLTPITYQVSNGDFQKIVYGTTTTVYSGANLNLTYYESSAYHANTLTAFTPTASTTPNVIGVKIVATITSGDSSATYSTIVRLRCGPKKTSPTD